jgi:hypothetical protein
LGINNHLNSSSLYSDFGFAGFLYRGLQFFSGKKQKHYEVLNRYIFCVLSKDLLQKGENHPIGNTFSYYKDMTPEYSIYYPDAIEHMKKDKGQNRLDELIEQYQNQIKIFNEAITNNGDLIVQQISSVCGVDAKLEKFKIFEIFTFLNSQLNGIKDDQDVHDWTNSENRGYEVSSDYREIQECVNKLIKDEIILGAVEETGQNKIKLQEIVTKVEQKASSISQVITDQVYNTNAKCCPSFISIFKDIINYD